jgi:site-specific recombinase XerD
MTKILSPGIVLAGGNRRRAMDWCERMTQDMQLKGLAKKTSDEYVRCTRRFVDYHSDRRADELGEPEGQPVAKLGEPEVRQFLLHRLVDDKVSLATQKVTVAALRFFFAVTVKRPEVAAAIGYPKVKSALPDILSGTETSQLLAALDGPKYRAIVMTTYGSGLRINEACGLRVEDIDSRRMLIHVRHPKGGKDRFVPLAERVLFMLRRYWAVVRPAGSLLFPGQEPGHPVSDDAVRHHLHEAAQKAGLHKRVTPHVLRHSFATHLLELGTDIRVIQMLLGHSSLQATLRYTRVTPTHASRVQSPIDVLGTAEAKAKLG